VTLAYPFIPETWTEPVNQGLYASVVFLIFQIGLGLIQTLLKRYWTVPSKVLSGLGWMTLTVPPVAIASISIVQGVVIRWMPAIFLLSLLPAVVVSIRGLNQLRMLRATGVHGAIREPNIAAYQDFLKAASSSFSFFGVGAEKLTRDFDVFQHMVSRCGTSAKPVRLLLVSPDAGWLQVGAARRGLNRTTFQAKQVDSLQKIRRIKLDFSGEIKVRFYSERPSLRLMFANGAVCWLGHYTETAATPGTNEFEQKSNSCVVLQRPSDRAPDQQLYGALEGLFDEMWETVKGTEWDFKTYLP
jgi:hypothetical protein